jgi:AraC-like DNA-binding protein
MNELYNTISIFLSSGWLLALGLVLLFALRADNPLLGNYRKARNMMAVAYIFFACINLLEYGFSGSESNIPLLRTIILAIAVSQAFLFTLAMLALLEVRFPGWRSIFREMTLAIVLIVAVFLVYTICPKSCFGIAFWILTGVYALLLIRYSVLFIRNYSRFRRRMNNYYSDNEADRLHWVVFSFFAALAVGVGALITSIFTSPAVVLGFTVVFDIFYFFFAIRFIDYAHRFSSIEEAMESDPSENDEQQQVLSAAIIKSIEAGLKSWTEAKLFLKPSVKIGDIAQYVGTNYKYISLYINKYIGHSFHEWIGGLRIEEAQHLMTDHPEMTIGEVARRVGISDKSNFIRQFEKQTHLSPNIWRGRKQK